LDGTFISCYEAPWWWPSGVPWDYLQPPGCELVIPQEVFFDEDHPVAADPRGFIAAAVVGVVVSGAILVAAAVYLGYQGGLQAALKVQEKLPLLVRLVVDVADSASSRGNFRKAGFSKSGSDGSFILDMEEGGGAAAPAGPRRALPPLPAFPAPPTGATVLDLADDARDSKSRRKRSDRRNDSAEALVEPRGYREERGERERSDRDRSDRDYRRADSRQGEDRRGEGRRGKSSRGDDRV
jgi:hypothetical protein